MNEKAQSLVTRFEVKDFNEDARTFQGLAATWDLDLGGDVIRQGAFKRTLKNWKSSKGVLPLLDSHNGGSVRNVVGKMAEAEENDAGLVATFEMIDGPDGDEVFRRVKGGYVDGLSIGYSAVKVQYPETEDEKQKGIWRYLDEVKLHEVSVVLWPMNPNARIDTSTAKALLLKARTMELTEDERAELTALSKEFGSLLAAPGPEPEAVDALLVRIQRLKVARLVTRIEAARHSAASLIERN